ncbi:MAG: DNA polymerase III subunit delta [Gemmatimonadaceae bacterium]
MAAPAERAFWKSLQAKSFKPVYYFYGDDDYLKAQALRALLAAAVDPATRDFNLDVRSAPETDAETLGSLLGTPPMMAERRVVVLRDVAGLKKETRAALDRYLGRGAVTPAEPTTGAAATDPDVVLVLVAAATGQGKADKVLEAKSVAIEFAPLDSMRVPKWIAHHVADELHTTISADAIALLDSAVGNDLPSLAAELDKLASYCGGAEIDEAAVAAVVGVRRGETLGDFLDRIAGRDALGALGMVSHILELPKTTAVSVVMALTVQTLALVHALGLRDRGVPASRLEGELFNLLRSAPGTFTGRPWGEATKSWSASVGSWSAASLEAALEALLAADIAFKETRLSSDEQLLSTLVLSICGGEASDDPAHRAVSAAPPPRARTIAGTRGGRG